MITKKTIDLSFNLILSIFSIWVIVESYELSLGELHEPGPGFLLFYGAIIMAILTLTNLIRLLSSYKKSDQAFSSLKNLRNLIYVITIIAVAILFFETLGFFITAFLIMILLMRIVGQERWLRISITAFFTVFLSFCIFKFLLQIQLPVGPLGF